ncbi:hypothetical protein HY733_01795 [Candidatus Uhrbacteria bacterium]|nr:hypothetical protein [Candidatus Uhrbacteria bacterium]
MQSFHRKVVIGILTIIGIFGAIIVLRLNKGNESNLVDEYLVNTIAVDRNAWTTLRSLMANTDYRSTTVIDERALLPRVTEVERWELFQGPISGADNFAPGIVALKEGGYRIYWNDYPNGGISSATSIDGVTFEADSGLRLTQTYEGSGCMPSHPWLVSLDDGYRMYYQAVCEDGLPADTRMYSAFSVDGLTFVPEGVRLDVGADSGLTYAGHGRILTLADGGYRLYFSANTPVMEEGEPSAILGATSTDGLRWKLDDVLTLEMGHDPAIVWVDWKAHMYVSFLAKNLLHLVSDDGYSFTPVAWVEFYTNDGTKFEEFGDIEMLVTDDGELHIYGGGKLVGQREGFPGMVIMKQSE